MKQVPTIGAIAVILGLMLTSESEGRSAGILPTSANRLTRTATASCGNCHLGGVGGPSVRVSLSARVLTPGQTIKVQVAATGGAAGIRGGFAADVTAGALIAGANTRISATGGAITHQSSSSRSWSMNYKAPTTPGKVQLFTVVNTVNGNGGTSGDRWAFHGHSSTATVSTPVRMFVNAPGVLAIGAGCADGNGNVGIYGAAEVPTVGNSQFKMEGLGLPPAARAMFIIGVQSNPSLDLTAMGAPGCFLHSDLLVTGIVTTTSGNVDRSGGKFTLPAPIPNDVRLRGFTFRSQLAVVDARSKRGLPVVFTNGLSVTIQ